MVTFLRKGVYLIPNAMVKLDKKVSMQVDKANLSQLEKIVVESLLLLLSLLLLSLLLLLLLVAKV